MHDGKQTCGVKSPSSSSLSLCISLLHQVILSQNTFVGSLTFRSLPLAVVVIERTGRCIWQRSTREPLWHSRYGSGRESPYDILPPTSRHGLTMAFFLAHQWWALPIILEEPQEVGRHVQGRYMPLGRMSSNPGALGRTSESDPSSTPGVFQQPTLLMDLH